jgi:hypothetical protein
MPSSGGAKRRWLSHYKSNGRHEGGYPCSSLRFAFQVQPVGIVDNAIKDTIAEGWVWETHKPICHGNLRSDQSRDAAETIVDDFEEVLGMGRGNGVSPPVIQDEQVESGQLGEQGGIGTVLVRNGQLVEQA